MAPRGHAFVNPQHRAVAVKEMACDLGFHSCGITDLSPTPHSQELTEWLDNGFAGTMAYMHRQERQRKEPASIIPGANRAVVVTRNYHSPDPPSNRSRGKVAKYARGRDYHEALREPLRQLADEVARLGGSGTIAKAFLDAGPVPERELAQRAGLGWIGKNTMLIDLRYGSFLFNASVLTNHELAADSPF